MSFLLDTNVVSDAIKARPDPALTSWLAQVEETQVFISVITLTEIRYGIDRLPRGRCRAVLDRWLSIDVPPRFAGRIIPIDDEIATACGEILADRRAIGRPMEVMDAFIAATARTIGLGLVTRNQTDFAGTVPLIINPWSA